MPDDILADWKSSRFVVADALLSPFPQGVCVILTDIAYWSENCDDLDHWCSQHHARREGMTVNMTQDTLLLFVLKWS